ncbi:MAG: S1C family serine protease [Planctomycetota bacterium]
MHIHPQHRADRPVNTKPTLGAGPAAMLLVALCSLSFSLVLCQHQAAINNSTGGGGGGGGTPLSTPRAVAARGELSGAEHSTIELFREASPSVVFIRTSALRRDLFSMNVTRIPTGTGSGFIWDDKGHIVTNYHVVANAQGADVILADQTLCTARLVGVAPDKDLAVLHIEAPADKLRAIPIGTSHDLQVGQSVFAIGNPFGLDHTLTTGVISGLGRLIEGTDGRPISGVIQTDAAINPGNSGGPLLDSAGRLIGINTSIVSPSGAYAGIGFAVPVDTINRIVPQLIEHGAVTHASLGADTADDRVARRLGLNGVLLLGVPPDSAAGKAGLQGTTRDARGRLILGDRIIAIDQQIITDDDDLWLALDHHVPGDTITLTVERGGPDEADRKQLTVKVTLDASR